MNNYNKFCLSKKCEHVIEWDYHFDSDCRPFSCVSCKKIGQSAEVNKYPDDCPFIDEITELTDEQD